MVLSHCFLGSPFRKRGTCWEGFLAEDRIPFGMEDVSSWEGTYPELLVLGVGFACGFSALQGSAYRMWLGLPICLHKAVKKVVMPV